MKFKIVHESRGRIRVQVIQNRMTLEQADLLEAYLCTWPAAQQVTVHERTCCAIVRYAGDRQELLTFLSRFSYTSTEIAKLAPAHTGRALNREYQEKLVMNDRVQGPAFCPSPCASGRRLTRCIAPFLTWSKGIQCLLRSVNCTWNCWTPCPSASPWSGRDFCHRRFRHVPAELGRAAGGVDPQEVRGRPGPVHVPERGPRLAAQRQTGEVLVPLTQVRPGDAIARPHGRHDPLGRGRRGRRGHGQPGLAHRRVRARARSAPARPSTPVPSLRRASASSRSRSRRAPAATTRSSR